MIIFAKRLRERPTECTLDGIVRHPQTHSLSTTERILDQILTYWLRSYKKDSKYEMHHKGNEPKC